MNRKHWERQVKVNQALVAKKRQHLRDLERSYRLATVRSSKNSFKGKITNCKGLIKTFEGRLARARAELRKL